MTDPKPLQPLAGGEAIGEELRAVLGARTGHEPSPADLASLEKRLAALLPPGTLPPTSTPSQAPPAPPAPPASPTPTLASSAAGKLVLAVALAGAVGGGAWLASERPETPSALPSPTSSATASESLSASPPSSSSTDPPALDAGVVAVASRPSSTHASASPSTTVAAVPEATLLARAHEELLHGAPEKALASATEHARVYPQGALAQEREVIAIEALVALGRRDEARRRAAAFHGLYPGSSHGGRVDRLVGGPAPPVPARTGP